MMIKASNYIKTGFSAEDAEKILLAITPLIESEDVITIDFDGIKFFTTLFFNNALSKFVLELGPEKYIKKFELKNLSEIGKTTYEHSLQNAREYYNLPDEKRLTYDKTISETEE